jgi:hypothetical protein
MENYVFQDWITAAGASTTPFVQEAKDWLGLASFSDVVFYLEIKQLVGTPAPGLTWNFQTAPTKDERLFQTLKSYGTSGIPPGGVQVFPAITGTASAPTPLATWLRWQIVATGGTTSWSTTFRVMVVANRVARLRW